MALLDRGLSGVMRRRAIADPANSLLTLCARPSLPEALVPELRRRVASVPDWGALLASAEEHGVAPLLYSHLSRGLVDVPTNVQRQLRAIYVRHRHSNQVRFGVLGEILDVFERAGIETRVLKGPALVALVYHDPGLRPISDLDLLVDRRDAVRAQCLLGEMGFAASLPASQYQLERHNHLDPASRMVDGVPIVVEIHHNALSADHGASLPLREAAAGMAFEVGSKRAYTLAPDEMLWHLCRHLVGVRHPLRLIWVADILGYAEAFVDQLDWRRLKRSHPLVLSTLSVLHSLTPMPDSVLERAEIAANRSLRRVGEDYGGWPTTPFVRNDWAGRLACLRRTLNPPDWWLRLSYGTGIDRAGRWTGWLRHASALIGMLRRRALDLVPRKLQPPEGARTHRATSVNDGSSETSS